MRKYSILLTIVLFCNLLSIPSNMFAETNNYLPEGEGLELNWPISETPPKHPNPKILNPANYEFKWKIDIPLMFDLVQDSQGVMYASDSDDIVHAVYPNGKEKWRIKLDMGLEFSVVHLNLGQDGTLYAYSSNVLMEESYTMIYAISSNGKIKWKLKSQNIYSWFNSHFSGDSQGNFTLFSNEGLISLDSKGKINWVNKLITTSVPWENSRSSHAVNIYTDFEGNLYLNSEFGEIISVDPSGVERWRTKPLRYVNKFTGFHPYFSDRGFLYMLTSDGLHALNTLDGSEIDLSNDADIRDIQSSGVPTDGKDGYYIAEKGRFFKINQAGVTFWEYKLREMEKYGVGNIEPPITDKEGNVYFNTGSGNIIALNSNGKEIFVFLRNAFWFKMNAIILGKNGNMYATLNDIGLVAFGKKQIQVYMDNLSLPLSVAQINNKGTILVPFRSLFEYLGLEIEWDAATKTIIGSKLGLDIKLTLGEKTAYVNGQARQLAEAPMIKNNTTFVPLRFVGEALGRKVSWESASSSVQID